MNKEHYKKLVRMYLSAPVNKFYNPAMILSEGRSEITIEVKEKHFHAAMAVHGSVYFKMLDDAAFFAANTVVEGVFVLTTSFNIHLLKPVDKGIIKSKGQLVFTSKNLFVAEAKLYDEQNNEIAFGSGNFVKSKIALSEEIGYI